MAIALFALLLHATIGLAQDSAQIDPVLGPAPRAPRNTLGLSGKGPRKLDVTGGFSVNGNSREQVRQFYNAVYTASDGVPLDSTANTANCIAGTNSAAFQNAVLLRINWFRAMSGIPASVTFSASESAEAQSAALMMSANNQLQHDGIPTNWSCFSSSGTNAADYSNLALGLNGPDAITGYIWDYGASDVQVGHRRLLLYPQTQVMASGDVPAQGTNAAANATWIFDSNFGGPRPATTEPYVAWPPPGYAPYPVVFPQWSFALSNADLSVASVTMQSNGVPLSIVVLPYQAGIEFGEDTLVWYPSTLDPTSYSTIFPFNGADTVYAITINNVNTYDGSQSFSYNVTVFDPALPGADYVPVTISGTSLPFLNESNSYSCTPSANPNTTGYQWVAAQSTNGNLADNALNGLTNFTIFPPPIYSVITNPPVGSGHCFHLTHTNPAPQLLQFTEVLFPATNTSLSFQSLLGAATANEVARVQFSTNDGATWVDLYAQPGTGGSGDGAFAAHTLSLSSCAGHITYVRFDYDYVGGSYDPQSFASVGWCLKNILITGASQLVNFATNVTVSTNFNFVPTELGNWVLEARGVIFNQFGLDWSPARQLPLLPPSITSEPLSQLVVSGSPATFTVSAGGTQPLSYQWQLDGEPISSATNSAYVINSVVATNTGFYGVVVTNAYGSATSSVAELNIETTNTPHASITVKITSPSAGGRTSTGVTGKATDTKLPIWNVLYWVTNFNEGKTVTSGQAVLTSGPTATNWSVANLPPGTNIIAVQAIDLASNRSAVATRRFFYEEAAPLNLLTQGAGNGSISVKSFVAGEKPSTNALNIGEEYQIAAKPDAHSLFGGWTVTTTNNSVSTNRAAINFIMESSLSITADFQTNVYLAASGTYNGLFAVNNMINEVTEDTAGFLGGLVIRTNGDYSGKLWIDGSGHAISGIFDAYGEAAHKISRAGGAVLLEMTMDATRNPPQIFGTVSGTNSGTAWTADLTADRAANNWPAAEYTMLIPPGTNAPPTNSPGGYGYALITNSGASAKVLNTAKISGALADGTTFSQTVTVSEDGYVPFYDRLYGNKGLLLGWINLEITNTTGVGLAWIHPKTSSGRYKSGFTNIVPGTQVELSPWISPPTGLAILTNLVISDTISDSTDLFDFGVSFSKTFTMSKESGTGFLTGSINPKNGLLKVTFGGSSTKTTNGFGAVLQNATHGGGYFLTHTNGQAIQLEP
ncbi:MAG: immunoglobulin domain-containing protein [Verrucomicrobiota bacterium]